MTGRATSPHSRCSVVKKREKLEGKKMKNRDRVGTFAKNSCCSVVKNNSEMKIEK